jgi:hypothetical protein
MKAGSKAIRSEIHRLINSIWSKESIILLIYEKGDKTDCSNYRDISLFNTYVQNFIEHPLVKANSICRGSVDFDVTGQTTDRIYCIR